MTSYIDCENNLSDALLQLNYIYQLYRTNLHPDGHLIDEYGYSLLDFNNHLATITDTSIEQHGIDPIVYANWVVDVMLKTEPVSWFQLSEILREEGKMTRENYLGFCRNEIENTKIMDELMFNYLVGLCQKEKCTCEPMNLVLECNDLVSHMSYFVK